MKIGYVGLGAMGGALATRLLLSQEMYVWDMRPESVTAFEAKGGIAPDSAVDLARKCDVILMCLPRSSNVQAAIFGEGGLLEGLSPGKIIVDQTSGDPFETRQMQAELEAQGISLIDAPVSGGVSGAAAGTIAIMVSGSRDSYDRVLPILHAISPNVHYTGGGIGAAQAVKIVNNTMSAGCRIATLEAAAMGRRMGLSLATIAEVVNANSGRNRTSLNTLPEIIEGRSPSANMAMALMLKDLNLSVGLGKQLGTPMIVTNVASEVLQIGVNARGPDTRLSEIIDLVQDMAGTTLAGVTSETSK
ncbi:NAD(P)-dependent oxidoreductase [Salipiger sp.]|uniref:NAD(P)-dependent oxidoreductase n=1 Tax=Salipiger sp. TaxID=2078585 RepID=UPI003A96E673